MIELAVNCFKAYDIRGRLGDELNEDTAYAIGRAFAQYLKAKTVVVGGDVRATSEPLKLALARGLMDSGSDVIDIGMVGTEEIYFATRYLGVDGGIEVTASHNPLDYNGMKLVRKDSKPISGDSGLFDIKQLVQMNNFMPLDPQHRGKLKQLSILQPYTEHLLTYIDIEQLTPLKLVVNPGNGVAGHVIDQIEKLFEQRRVPISFIKLHHQPDATFPNGIPNPLLIENRASTAEAVLAHQADMGIAWDGDFDRCFLFDHHGEFIEGYYIVGLLAEQFLLKEPGAKIIHDPRLTFNTIDIVNQCGGESILSKTGHAFIKERMRDEDAIYGGEMSAHHYFRDFGYCDSGMIPWLLVASLLCRKQQPLSALVSARIAAYPSSGEINTQLKEPDQAIEAILQCFQSGALLIDKTDGISVEFNDWRFNLRKSNTEPLLRLNVESRTDRALMAEKTAELLAIIQQY